MNRRRAAAQFYVWTVIVAGLGLLLARAPFADFSRPGLFVAILALAAVTASFKVRLPVTKSASTMSVSYAVNFLALLVLGADAATLVTCASAVSQCTLNTTRRNPLTHILFSVASLVITMQVAGQVHRALGGTPGALPDLLPSALAAAALVYFLTNTLLVAAAIGVSNDQSVVRVWRDNFLWSAPGYLVGAGIAAGAARLVTQELYGLALLVGASLFLVYQAYDVYLGRVHAEQRRTEQLLKDLQAAHEGLEHRVRERTAELAAANQALQTEIIWRKQIEAELACARDAALDSTRMKSEFVANISHEIRTPLNGVIGMTGFLLDTPLTDEQREYADTIRSSADSLLHIIGEVLDFSKIEAGKLVLESAEFDLRELVEAVVDLLAPQAHRQGLEIAAAFPWHFSGLVRGDQGRFRQIVMNLVGNALKFTARGEVIVRVEVSEQSPRHAIVRVAVHDSGIGITEEQRGRIFDAFTQADGSTTRKYGGTGLGLTISKQLVEAMSGEIGVDSIPGEGSTFWFAVPMETTPAAIVPSPVNLGNRRVLVAVHNRAIREILEHAVTGAHGHPVGAASSLDAWRLLQPTSPSEDRFDLAIVDAELPESGGFAIENALRADATLADLPVILMTRLGSRLALPDRCADTLTTVPKPFRQAHLIKVFRWVLREGEPERVGADQREGSPAGARHSDDGRRQRRVLIAEDNIVNQKVAIRQLQKLGYQPDAVANGRQVIESLGRAPYDIVLMDCQMPEMDGYEATTRVRALEGSERRTVIIALTAHARSGERERCIEIGMDDYLVKPIKIEDLRATMEYWEERLTRQARHADAAASDP